MAASCTYCLSTAQQEPYKKAYLLIKDIGTFSARSTCIQKTTQKTNKQQKLSQCWLLSHKVCKVPAVRVSSGDFLWTNFSIPLWFPGQPGWVCPQRHPLQLQHLLYFSLPSPSPLLHPPPHHQELAHQSSYAGHLYPQAVASKYTVRSRL